MATLPAKTKTVMPHIDAAFINFDPANVPHGTMFVNSSDGTRTHILHPEPAFQKHIAKHNNAIMYCHENGEPEFRHLRFAKMPGISFICIHVNDVIKSMGGKKIRPAWFDDAVTDHYHDIVAIITKKYKFSPDTSIFRFMHYDSSQRAFVWNVTKTTSVWYMSVDGVAIVSPTTLLRILISRDVNDLTVPDTTRICIDRFTIDNYTRGPIALSNLRILFSHVSNLIANGVPAHTPPAPPRRSIGGKGLVVFPPNPPKNKNKPKSIRDFFGTNTSESESQDQEQEHEHVQDSSDTDFDIDIGNTPESNGNTPAPTFEEEYGTSCADSESDDGDDAYDPIDEEEDLCGVKICTDKLNAQCMLAAAQNGRYGAPSTLAPGSLAAASDLKQQAAFIIAQRVFVRKSLHSLKRRYAMLKQHESFLAEYERQIMKESGELAAHVDIELTAVHGDRDPTYKRQKMSPVAERAGGKDVVYGFTQ